MKILITGATGFVGRALVSRLARQGHELSILSRNVKSAREALPYPCEFHEWDFREGFPPAAAFNGIEAVIHLAGESVAQRRWSAEQKAKIKESRALGTRNLIEGIRSFSPSKLSTFISASATGFYGDRGSEELEEASGPGRGFLADVCREWESEAKKITIHSPQTRLAILRIGIVLGREGGALDKMLPVFNAGLGGRLGDGSQFMSWIHIDDLVNMIVTALNDAKWSGVFNAVSPQPVTNAEFTRRLAGALQRPALFPVPRLALRIALGELSKAVLESQKVLPKAAQRLGFTFKHDTLVHVFSDLIGDKGARSRHDSEFIAEQWVPRRLPEVFEFFSEAKNLEAITPAWLNFHIVKMSTPKIEEKTLIDYKLKIHGAPVRWRSRIEDWSPGKSFVDTQVRGPYSKWHHTHAFEEMRGGTLIRDHVVYRIPLGFVGRALLGKKIRSDIEEIFRHRRRVINELFGS